MAYLNFLTFYGYGVIWYHMMFIGAIKSSLSGVIGDILKNIFEDIS